jgi:ABC-type sugar transport system permease subunit
VFLGSYDITVPVTVFIAATAALAAVLLVGVLIRRPARWRRDAVVATLVVVSAAAVWFAPVMVSGPNPVGEEQVCAAGLARQFYPPESDFGWMSYGTPPFYDESLRCTRVAVASVWGMTALYALIVVAALLATVRVGRTSRRAGPDSDQPLQPGSPS